MVGTDVDDIIPALRRHLDRHGLTQVEVRPGKRGFFKASRLDPEDPWVSFASASLERTTGHAPVILPNLGGSLPNDIFVDVLKLKTIWIPHSYAGCSQHATGRAPAGADRPRRSRHYGRAVLGPWRAGNARAESGDVSRKDTLIARWNDPPAG